MINSGITGHQINIKKYVVILPLLVWVGHSPTRTESKCATIHHVKDGRICPQRAGFLEQSGIKKPFRWSHCY